MKNIIKSFVLMVSISANGNAQNCKPQLAFSPNAEFKINGGTSYYNNNPNVPTVIPAITLGLGATSFMGTLTAIQNVNCIPIMPAQGSLCPGSKTDIKIQNPNVPPASGNYIQGIANTLSYNGGLQPGVNTITVYANCLGGPTGGPNGQVIAMAAFKINVIETPATPFAATITNECQVRVSGPQHTASYTGKKVFKFRLASLPPAGTQAAVFVLNTTGAYVFVENKIINAAMLNIDIPMDNNGQGHSYGNYQVRFLNNGIQLFPIGTTTAYTHAFSFRTNSCYELIKSEIAPSIKTRIL